MSVSCIIPLLGRKEGRHTFDFEIGEAFFEEFEGSEITGACLLANVVMLKRSNHIDLTVTISGSVSICCDRCLDFFPQPLLSENRIILKYGRRDEEEDPDIITIAPDEPEFDLKQHIYEYICLALPIKRVHPDDEAGNSTCNPEMLKKLNEHLIKEEKTEDPRWNELKKLMNDN